MLSFSLIKSEKMQKVCQVTSAEEFTTKKVAEELSRFRNLNQRSKAEQIMVETYSELYDKRREQNSINARSNPVFTMIKVTSFPSKTNERNSSSWRTITRIPYLGL